MNIKQDRTDLEEALRIAKSTLYLNKNLSYIKNVSIVEYDIKSAGFSVIKEKKLLPEKVIKKLEGMNKEDRNILIGKYQKNIPTLSKEIVDTLSEVRQAFVQYNDIKPEEILSIKKDAIFLINKKPTYLKFGENFVFRPKDSFTSYIYLNDLEVFYSSIDKKLVVKNFKSMRNAVIEYGESAEDFDPNKEPLFLDIKRFLALSEKSNKDVLFEALKNYRSLYLNRELPKETYRDVETSWYFYRGKQFKYCTDEMFSEIDISSNYINYLRPLFEALL